MQRMLATIKVIYKDNKIIDIIMYLLLLLIGGNRMIKYI